MTNIDINSKVLGGMLGSAIGDAIGELAFSYPEKESLITQLKQTPELTYTDDTAMVIGLAESILKDGGIDQHRLGETFHENFLREPWRGYASGPPTIFSQVQEHGVTYREAAKKIFGGRGSFGNGAAMRVVPVGLFFYHSRNLYDQATASSEVTHTHPIGIDGAAVQARAVAQAVLLDTKEKISTADFIQGLINFSRTAEIESKMKLVKDLIASEALPDDAMKKIGRSVAVHESMPFAIYAFLKHATSFEACLFCAILNGGDRDTLGAMAGAISGAYLGFESIPESWRKKLENRDYIEKLAQDLADKMS
jgi:poly(ADP-ribose) glycohydrolase ARH3